MSGEIDLSGEQDATERMTELDEEQIPDDVENERKAEFEGEATTEDFDVSDAIDRVGDE